MLYGSYALMYLLVGRWEGSLKFLFYHCLSHFYHLHRDLRLPKFTLTTFSFVGIEVGELLPKGLSNLRREGIPPKCVSELTV